MLLDYGAWDEKQLAANPTRSTYRRTIDEKNWIWDKVDEDENIFLKHIFKRIFSKHLVSGVFLVVSVG